MSNGLAIRVTFLNKDRNGQIGEDVHKTEFEEPRELFRHCKKTYGRCTSRMMRDRRHGESVQTGWIFEKKVPYDDAPDEMFTQETWVEVVQPVDVRVKQRRWYPQALDDLQEAQEAEDTE